LPRNGVIASGETSKRKPAGWDENEVGAVGNDAPVITLRRRVPIRHGGLKRADSICRTAVYVTRTHGGVGGGSREVFPYPDVCRAWHVTTQVRVLGPGFRRAEG
jgi:uncharacterized protein (DUF2235 family)